MVKSQVGESQLRFDSLVHATKDGVWPLDRRYESSVERLIDNLTLAGATKACLVGIPGVVDNQSVWEIACKYPDTFIPIGGINPAGMSERAIKQEVRKLADSGFKGLKLHPRLNGYHPSEACCLDAINLAGEFGLVVFLDTLFRQPTIATRHVCDVVDLIAVRCQETRIILLHGGGTAMLDLFELVRSHAKLILDLSFSLLRYAESSVDLDIRFVCRELDERVVVGSDYPQYTPVDAFKRFDELTNGLSEEKLSNIRFNNLARLFC